MSTLCVPTFESTGIMSVTTTQKNTNFQGTPLQDVKNLTDVPGVGAKSAEKLMEANIDTAVKLMGNFMVRASLLCVEGVRMSVKTEFLAAASTPNDPWYDDNSM